MNIVKNSLKDIGLQVCVYNPKEPTAEKKLIGCYNSYRKAGRILGIEPGVIRRKCISKERIYSPHLKIEIALRLKRYEISSTNTKL